MSFSKTTPSAVFTIKKHPELVKTLVNRLGEPIDSYWNGSHTWFDSSNVDDFEWRLHPVSGFKMPEASRPEDLLELALENEIDVEHYWEGLEVFPISEEPCTLEVLNQYVNEKIGILPDVSGLVDHESIGNEFERNSGNVSVIKLLISQIRDEPIDS